MDTLSSMLRALAGLLALLLAAPLQAHQSSDAYLRLADDGTRTSLRWEIALRDLDTVLPELDADGDRRLTWREVRQAWPAIDALALSALAVPGCRFVVDGHELSRRSDGAYAVLRASAPCRVGASTPVHYALFHGVDPTHRGLLVRVDAAGQAGRLQMLVPAPLPAGLAAMAAAVEVGGTGAGGAVGQASAPAAPATAPTPAEHAAAPVTAVLVQAEARASTDAAPSDDPAGVGSLLVSGIEHLLTGYDHLVFLGCLLLPAVLRRERGDDGRWRWVGVARWQDAVWPVVGTVSLFTLAHSVTLALAVMGWLQAPGAWVEPAIAATIAVAAIDNIRPLLRRWRAGFTFAFGLVHGLGFAGVLGEMDLPASSLGLALLEFNIGLELGQLMVVAVAVPLLLAWRRAHWYVPAVLKGGSVAALAMAVVWGLERTGLAG